MSLLDTKDGKREVVFLRASLDDAALLTATRQKVWDATYRGIYPDVMIDDYAYETHLARDKNRITDPKNTVWLAMDGKDCVGYLYVGPCGYGQYKDFDFCLNSLYFLPPYQGKGLGRAAFELAAAECRRRGYDRFFCGCSAHNRKARGFYEHMGGKIGAQSVGHENRAEDLVYYEFYIGETP